MHLTHLRRWCGGSSTVMFICFIISSYILTVRNYDKQNTTSGESLLLNAARVTKKHKKVNSKLETTTAIKSIYYINLDKNTIRRTFMENWLNATGYAFQRISAVTTFSRECVHEDVLRCSGVVGLIKTELKIMDTMETSGLTLVFEDDFKVNDFAQLLRSVKAVPRDWDIIRFNCKREEDLKGNRVPSFGDFRVYRTDRSLRGYCGGTHAMLWRESSIYKIRKLWSRRPYNGIDCVLQTDSLRSYCLNGIDAELKEFRRELTDIPKRKGDECSSCIKTYIQKMRELEIMNELSYEEWEAELCRPSYSKQSQRPLVFGAGPSGTAAKSFALALNHLRSKVLNYDVELSMNGKRIGTSDSTLKKYNVENLLRGMNSSEGWRMISALDFTSLLQSLDAVFDAPWPMYAVEILKAFPQSKVIMTDRDPVSWYAERKAFCTQYVNVCANRFEPMFCTYPTDLCAVPFILRPLNLSIFRMTELQAVESYRATQNVLKCLVGESRYFKVDAHGRIEGGWIAAIAQFLKISPPNVKDCLSLPFKVRHNMSCSIEDQNCLNCQKGLKLNMNFV